MVKVAISGKANSGKNTVANNIIASFFKDNQLYKVSAFADPIKEIVLIMFPFAERGALYGPSKMRSLVIPESKTKQRPDGITYRQALCDLGAHGRAYDENKWVKIFVETYKKQISLVSGYVASDVRFPNELEALKELGFFTIRIKRDNFLKIDDISEKSQDQIPDSAFDIIIDNNGTLEFLENQCSKASFYLQKGSHWPL